MSSNLARRPMVKFTIDIPDEEWNKQIKCNQNLEDNAKAFDKAFGYVEFDTFSDAIDMRGVWKIAEVKEDVAVQKT